MGGLEVVRWPNSLMGLFKFYDIDWHKELKKALKNETYLANFLNMDKWDWQTPDVNSIEEAKDYASFKGWSYEKDLSQKNLKDILYDNHHSGSLFHVNLFQRVLYVQT